MVKRYISGKSIVVLVVFLFSCKPISYISVIDYRPKQEVSENAFVYALPQTVVRVDVEAVRKTFLHGPYAAYSAQFLGIEGVPQWDSTHWSISDVDILTYQQADASHYYTVQAGEEPVSFDGFFAATSEGLIIDPSRTNKSQPTHIYTDDLEKKANVFTDLSLEGNLGIVKDTLYRLVFRDTAFVKTPLIRRKVEEKSKETLAEEAANYIFDIREARFFIITADNPVLPAGEAMQASLNEMRRQENEYLSLFLGKTYYDTVRYSYEYIPKADRPDEKHVMFRFSKEMGFLPDNYRTGDPVVLALKSDKNDLPMNESPSPEKQNRIYYRMAIPAGIDVLQGKRRIASTRRMISQYGNISGIPLNISIRKAN